MNATLRIDVTPRVPLPMASYLWIAWETQRRSITLANRLACRLRILDFESSGWLRYPLSACYTVLLLFRERHALVVAQNPSMALAAIACILKPLFRFALVIDRHSNFLLGRNGLPWWKRTLFTAMSRFTLRSADLTLVTNDEIAERVSQAGGRAFILPDPFPDLPAPVATPPRPVPEIVFVCSWAQDEPIDEVMAACRLMQGEIVMHVTGKPKASHRKLLASKPDNFRPTGFLPDGEYLELLGRADAIAVLTTMPSTLVCGAYEASALVKPMLLSGSRVLRDYFPAGAVHLDSHQPEEIVRKLRTLISRLCDLRDELNISLDGSRRKWNSRLIDLQAQLQRIQGVATK